MWWRIMRWLDRRWCKWHARGTVRPNRNWSERRPRLWVVTGIPLSTWLRQFRTGWESCQAHLEPLLLKLETQRLMDDDPESGTGEKR